MCGRYQRRSDKQRIAEAFQISNLHGLALESDLDLTPNYNVAPQTMQPVIVWDETIGMRTLHMMFWRFLPPFCSDPKTFKLSTVNASADNVLKSGLWKESFLKRRCLVPLDTFVEWQVEGKQRLPWVFSMTDDAMFALGGVWRRWYSPDKKQEMETFAVITVEPNELVEKTTHHDRMPLIVARSDWQRWLEPCSDEQPPIDLLRPFDAERMKAWRSDAAINSVRNTGPELGAPLKEDDVEQSGLF
ncbi:MAG TPA: SOS response-associated peptidase [Silvibacterium sp.]|nr:SOS response-associated peptidase [Silvibacterium sp.]